MRLGRLFGTVAAFGIVLIAAQGCALLGEERPVKEERLCTPGAYVFCRCADRTEGTKLCKPDGKSFEPCQTSENGECRGGEIPDERTNEEIIPPPDDYEPGKEEPLDAENECPGKSTAVLPNVELKIEGDTSKATSDREGRSGACAVGAGANDHVYRLIPSGSGSLEIQVKGSDGLNPLAYIRTTCDDAEAQVACAPPTAQSTAQLKTNVVTGKSYYLVIDGASGSTGKYVVTAKLTTRSFCGDGQIDEGEACDDGNKTDDDGCSNDCRKVNGNPPSGGGCPGHPLHLWPGQVVTGTGSTAAYGNAWNKPSAACDKDFSNAYQDHVYEVTPHASGTMVVTVTPATATNFMLTARRSCDDPSTMTAAMCVNDFGVSSSPERLTVSVTANQKIWVAVDGGGVTSNKGDYTISFELE